jgi:hypothetical protein
MSERQPDPEKAARSDNDEPDVEGHRFAGPEEPQRAKLNDDEPEDDDEGKRPR